MQVKALENFRENVRTAMTELSLTQDVLADRARISRPYLNRVLAGKQEPSITVCDKISDALSVSFALLLSTPQAFRRHLKKIMENAVAVT